MGIAAVLLLRGLIAYAETDSGDTPNYALRGFGTLGGVYHNDDGVIYRRDISQDGGAKANRISLAQDSMFGAQLTLYPSEQFELSAQAVSRLTTENNFEPVLTWGYLKFKPTEDSALRFGRLGVETYLQGDSAEIGYANLLIRQPVIFYPRTFDGMDAEITQPLGSGTIRLKGMAGWTQGELIGFGEPYDTGGSQLLGFGLEYALDGWTGRFSMGRLRLYDEVNELKPGSATRAALDSLPNAESVIAATTMKNRQVDYHSLALAYDSGPIQAVASYSILSSPGWSDRHLFYANMGYHLGKVTPYISYSSQRSSRDFVSSGIPDGIGYDALNRTVASAQAGTMINQTGMAIGARYDFIDNMALKLQVDHIRYRDPESLIDNALSAEAAESRTWHSLTVFSLALDFVF
ncbi:hypothetical protein IVG45_06425 [Methylomonas sp. LL1]|uniref:hypothetical protein n=1 Tax=Methylomonas sp. LL1 TaxID=2785785 RepID=UPI0018C3B14D|nr:hypothetical protein [Methylomonas sp. LL1]QPK64588.1 hypothetical protein IVG45_06425 [Methylomonas sp. LL1]